MDGVVRRVQSGVRVEGPAIDPELFADAAPGAVIAVDHGVVRPSQPTCSTDEPGRAAGRRPRTVTTT